MFEKKINLKSLLTSKKGGLSSIIAIVVSIIMVLSLISYSVLSQVAGAKATADKAAMEQQKINLMLQNPNIVTGNTVITYINYAIMEDSGLKVTVELSGGTKRDFVSGDVWDESLEIMDNELYEMIKKYDSVNMLTHITFEIYK
ncbi:MAG TPA: hypothetical protein GXX49_02635 [Clostridiaceae bacterium]|nr:hypothetical protein [Clostridiaceae bacterium]